MSKGKRASEGVMADWHEDSAAQAVDAAANGDAARAAKPPETKAQRFERLVERRMVRALKALAAVAKLANRSQYAYEEADAALVMEDLGKGLLAVSTAFAGRKSVDGGWKLRR